MMKTAILSSFLPLALAIPAIPAVSTGGSAPLIVPSGAIPGQYIVQFQKSITGGAVDQFLDSILAKVSSGSNGKKFQINDAFNGFTASLSSSELKLVRQLPGILSVTQDAVVHTSIVDQPQGSAGLFEGRDLNLQRRAPVSQTTNDYTQGLGRISHRQNTQPLPYVYEASPGKGACAYVIDTGIDLSHPDFGRRATWLANYVNNVNTDENGHGTHVAGILGSQTFGVAKNVTLFAIKVLGANGAGTIGGVIQGINYAAYHYKKNGSSCPKGAVANLSLGSGFAQSVNDAVHALIGAGVFVALAAGNDHTDAANTSPASTPDAFTVAALDKNDGVASFSNYGAVVDIVAPGLAINSTWPGKSWKILSGTSMASPHVAGLGAYLLAKESIPTPAALTSRINTLATTGKITNIAATVPSSSSLINAIPFNGNPLG